VEVDVLFFFSSRRRHTRFSRDWSSDVCSSDLWDLKRWCCLLAGYCPLQARAHPDKRLPPLAASRRERSGPASSYCSSYYVLFVPAFCSLFALEQVNKMHD